LHEIWTHTTKKPGWIGMSGDHTNNLSWCGVELQNIASKERHFLVVQIWYYIRFCQFMIFRSIFLKYHESTYSWRNRCI